MPLRRDVAAGTCLMDANGGVPNAETRGRSMVDFDDVKKFADEHDKQVDEGMQKAGDEASQRFGHEQQVDKLVNEGQERTGSGDQVP